MHNAGGLLEAVQQQLHTDSILGWFAYRSSSSLQPTAQDEMLSRSMASARNSLWGQQQSTVLFALVSLQQCHDGASQDFQQRTFQLNSNRYYYDSVCMCWTACPQQEHTHHDLWRSAALIALPGNPILACMCSKNILHVQNFPACICKTFWLQRPSVWCETIR